MHRTISAAAALLAAALSASALAQRTDEEQKAPTWVNNLYVGINGGQAHWRPGCPGGGANCDDTNGSVGVFAGYQINRIFAAEAAYNNLGKITFGGSSLKATAWEATGIAMLPAGAPFHQALSLYARFGAYRANIKGNAGVGKETDPGVTYGAGAQFDFTPKIAARFEWQRYSSLGGSTVPSEDIDVWRAAALWRFK